jgi:hypothetical protein
MLKLLTIQSIVNVKFNCHIGTSKINKFKFNIYFIYIPDVVCQIDSISKINTSNKNSVTKSFKEIVVKDNSYHSIICSIWNDRVSN